MSNNWSCMLAAAFFAAAAMPFVIRARGVGHAKRSSPQHVHKEPTSRLGGGVVFLAFVGGITLAAALEIVPRRPVFALLACALPVFIAGIWEDLTHKLSPRERLVAAAVSGLLASLFAGGVIARLDLPFMDDWLAVPFVAIALTCFMVMGACNAFNLIDGVHGLMGGTTLMMFAGMAVAAAQLGDQLVLVQSMVMVGALAGFLFWNYPHGRVFMGDGGAYFAGFIYAELSVQIVARNPGLSAWFVIMLAAYPIVETLYSIYRRKIVLRTPSTEPDALHLHSLFLRWVAATSKSSGRHEDVDRANSRVAPRLWVHGAICCLLALILRQNTGALIAGLIAYAAFYLWQYRLMVHRHDPHAAPRHARPHGARGK